MANRLQAAVFQECVNLVLEGVVNPKELDTVVNSSLGLRYAAYKQLSISELASYREEKQINIINSLNN